MSTEIDSDIECCPRFDPIPWNDKIFQWDNKRFIKDKVFTFFYVPINFWSVIVRMNKKVENVGAKIPDWLCLSDHTSKWNMDLYLAVNNEIPGAENVLLSWKFLSKVYEGNFWETGKWSKDFEKYTQEKNIKIWKMYMWYTTCPKCAKKYWKNYVVIIWEIL